MPSSKFSPAPPSYKRPVVCKPGPPHNIPCYPDYLLLALQAFCTWVDLDPMAPQSMTKSFQIIRQTNIEPYFGESASDGDRLDLLLTPHTDPERWDARLRIWSQFSQPEEMQYAAIFVNPKEHFDTGFFGDTNIPNQDFRRLRVLE